MNATPKIDNFVNKCILWGLIQNNMVDDFFKFPKFFLDMARIIQIAKAIEADGLNKKELEGTSQWNGFSPNMSWGKEYKKFGPSYQK